MGCAVGGLGRWDEGTGPDAIGGPGGATPRVNTETRRAA